MRDVITKAFCVYRDLSFLFIVPDDDTQYTNVQVPLPRFSIQIRKIIHIDILYWAFAKNRNKNKITTVAFGGLYIKWYCSIVMLFGCLCLDLDLEWRTYAWIKPKKEMACEVNERAKLSNGVKGRGKVEERDGEHDDESTSLVCVCSVLPSLLCTKVIDRRAARSRSIEMCTKHWNSEMRISRMFRIRITNG